MRASERLVMMTEFKHGIGAYLATRVVVDAEMAQPRTLADLIPVSILDHAELEMSLFGQEQFERAQESGPIDGEAYLEGAGNRAAAGRRGRARRGIGRLQPGRVDRADRRAAPLIDPQFGETFQGGSSRCAAVAGYPLVTVPGRFCAVGGESGAAVRTAHRSHLHGPGVERAGADSPRVRL